MVQCCAFRNLKSRQRCPYRAKHGFTCGIHNRCKLLHTSIDDNIAYQLKTNGYIEEAGIQRLSVLRRNISARLIYKWWNVIVRKQTKYLDELYCHHLLLGEETWANVPYSHRFYIAYHNEWWPISTLIGHVTQQLNHADMNGPCIMYPSSPFNRKPYMYSDIVRLTQQWWQLGNIVHCSLQTLVLPQNRRVVLRCFERYRISNTQYDPSRSIGRSICALFYQTLRYRIINATDSQRNYVGVWVYKNVPVSDFETVFRRWDSVRPFIFDQSNDLKKNPIKLFIATILQDYPKAILNLSC